MSNETDLSPPETRDFRRLASVMIPASAEFGVPDAGDPAIFADILKSLGRDHNDVKAALADLAALSGGPFSDLDTAKQEAVAGTFHAKGNAQAATLGRVVLSCYYRDDRVVRSLGFEPGPPFPKGHTLEQGDWSLLDRVKTLPKMWRDAP